ncbi:hypothetical protein EW145_g5342 [Phellinidium pouzarii]|uniref:Ras-domain-containing protein n=1 Tax=Phellinidium pouzarii TaxID=167371 RepID=A0A4S4L093_9AGAM|nr:hypothetical protein EW145_g5342 [Phellinidium pouzarii]
MDGYAYLPLVMMNINLPHLCSLRLFDVRQDTAGQERFSSLSSAFFRGADAALLMFDVTRPETLAGLKRWWEEFCACAPVRDEDARDYCVVVVGNKLDLAEDAEVGVDGGAAEIERRKVRVTEAEAERFLEELVPREEATEGRFEYSDDDGDEGGTVGGGGDDPFVVQNGGILGGRTSGLFLRSSISGFSLHSVHPKASPHLNAEDTDSSSGSENDSPQRPRTQSISIQRLRGGNGWSAHTPRVSKSHASDRSQFGGTMSTTRTAQTLFHTPASSIFDAEAFESAPSSPLLSYASVNSHSHARSCSRPRSRSQSYDRSSYHNSQSRSPSSPTTPSARAVRRMASGSSSSSVPTITPSLFLRTQPSASTSASQTPPTPPEADDNDIVHFPFARSHPRAHTASQPPPTSAQSPRPTPSGLLPRPERGPRLFLASAKTGAGVAPVFEYIAQRVVRRWEYAEAHEGGRGAARGDMLRLTDMRRTSSGRGWASGRVSCCGS